jgi:PAS domain S-box-containing protein
MQMMTHDFTSTVAERIERCDSEALERFFPGDSELAQHMRRMDWANTDLGSPERWPENLRVAVSICLTSSFPTLLLWGSSFTVLYNDAYIPLLGARKHLRFLGQPGWQCWSEIWDSIGPMLEGVRTTGKATWSEDIACCFDRDLPQEEVFVRFSCGPLLAEDGRTVEGIFTPCTETTEQVVGARRLETLQKLATHCAHACSVESACVQAARTLGENALDVAFAAIYVTGSGNREPIETARLLATAGLPEHHVFPQVVTAAGSDDGSTGNTPGLALTLASALNEGRTHVTPDVASSAVELPGGAWPEPSPRAVVVPFYTSSQSTVAGLVALGCSPRRVWDHAYRTFFERVAERVGTSVSSARAHSLLAFSRIEAGHLDASEARVEMPTGSGHLSADSLRTATSQSGAVIGLAPAPSSIEEANGWFADRPSEFASELDAPEVEAVDTAIRLLIADGNADRRTCLECLLRPLGAVQVVADGEQALAAIQHRLPDLVLSDVMLPKLDGFELVRALRANETTRTLPVVLVAARAGEEAHVESLNTGADDYIVKPFSERELVARVRAQLTLARQRRQHERELRRSEALLRTVVDNSRDGINLLELATRRYTFLSPAQAELTGFTAEELANLSTEEIQHRIHPEDRQIAVQQQRQAVAGQDVGIVEYRWMVKSGEYRWFSDSRRLVRGLDGKPTALVGVIRDITEHKAAEHALQRSESRFRELAEVIPHLVFEVNADGTAGYFNSAWVAYTGVAPGNFEQRLEFVHPEDRDHLYEVWQAASVAASLYECEFRFKRYDGQFRWFLARAVPVKDGSGNVLRWLGAATDIHDVKLAQDALQDADKRKNQFLAVLSHELRNPLAPITNGLYILDHVAPGGEQATRAKQVIQRQVVQLSKLVNDLLEVTRITRNKVQLQIERVELNELVRQVVEDNQSLFDKAHVALEVELASRSLHIVADRTRIAQALGNLLQNAAKFASPGGRARLSTAADATEAIVHVSDNGIGMTEETLACLFEPFMQADRTLDRSKGGLGLGLALVKGFIELHGGRVRAFSAGLGQGAEVTVSVPLEASTAFARNGRDTPHEQRSRRILIIEDNVDAAQSLREVLELAHHQVDVAYAGPEGLVKARASLPDAILCDIGLPGMNGFEVARILRRDETLRDTLLIALSGYALPEDLDRALHEGFDAHLSKPLNLDKLNHILSARSAE